MPPKSAVERSEYRLNIDNLLLEGKGSRYVSDWLKERGESISHTAINNYRKNKLNVHKEATIRYNEKKSKERMNKAVEKKVSEIEYCDDLIDAAAKVGIYVDPDQNISNLDIKKLGLQAIKIKHEITKDEPEDKEITIKIVGVGSDEDNNMEVEQETGQ